MTVASRPWTPYDGTHVRKERRGHSLTIDSGWRQVADVALQFIKRFV